MYKFLSFFLILFFSLDISANENCNSSDPDLTALCNTADDAENILDTMLKLGALGVVVMVAGTAFAVGTAVSDSDVSYNTSFKYDFANDKIVFEGDHRLENLEINFSNPIKQSQHYQSFQINEEHYIGLTWRF